MHLGELNLSNELGGLTEVRIELMMKRRMKKRKLERRWVVLRRRYPDNSVLVQ